MNELGEKFGKDKVFFIKCNVLNKDDIVSLYEVRLIPYYSPRTNAGETNVGVDT